MKAFINGYQISGHPKEIAELLKAMEVKITGHNKAPKPTSYERIVNESQSLRQKLEQNPSFDPFPGVLPGEDVVMHNMPAPGKRLYAAEDNTGVQS